jgi:hypothetical protein
MRLGVILVSVILGTLAATLPAQAQTYNPHYPVCMQVYAPFMYFDCRFTSIPQCKASASARGAQCVVNPYFEGDVEPPPVRRHRRAY